MLLQTIKKISVKALSKFKEGIFKLPLFSKNANREKRILAVFIVVIIIAGNILVVPSVVRAAEEGNTTIGNVVLYIMQVIMWAIRELITWFLPSIAKLAEYALGTTKGINIIEEKGGVTEVWTTVRDISNMFFVLFFLIIAIGTVLKIESYHIRKLLPMFIIAVLLVNFSMLICKIIIDFSQVLMNAFSSKVPDVMKFFTAAMFTEPGDKLSNSPLFEISPNLMLFEGDTPKAVDLTVQMVVTLLYIGILAFVFLAVAVFLVIRVVALWFLTALSPFAFLFMVLPQTQAIARKWWSSFMKYAIFGPAMAFFIYLAAVVVGKTEIKNINDAIKGINGSGSASVLGPLFTQLVFISILLIAGIIISRQLGIAGAGAITGFGMGMGKRVGRAVGWPARMVPVVGKKAYEKVAKPLAKAGARKLDLAVAPRLTGGRIGAFGAIPGIFERGKRRDMERLDVAKKGLGDSMDRLKHLISGGKYGAKTDEESEAKTATISKRSKEIVDSQKDAWARRADMAETGNKDEAAAILLSLAITGDITKADRENYKTRFGGKSKHDKKIDYNFDRFLARTAFSKGVYDAWSSEEMLDVMNEEPVSRLQGTKSKAIQDYLLKRSKDEKITYKKAKDKYMQDAEIHAGDVIKDLRKRMAGMGITSDDDINEKLGLEELQTKLEGKGPETFIREIAPEFYERINSKIEEGLKEGLSGANLINKKLTKAEQLVAGFIPGGRQMGYDQIYNQRFSKGQAKKMLGLIKDNNLAGALQAPTDLSTGRKNTDYSLDTYI